MSSTYHKLKGIPKREKKVSFLGKRRVFGIFLLFLISYLTKLNMSSIFQIIKKLNIFLSN